MFVITIDQVGSRHDRDRAGELCDRLNRDYGDDLALPADQNSGDEVQAVVDRADAAVRLVLSVARTNRWSIGVGVGNVRMPLPDATRKATGDAFIAARDAVTAAKRSEARFAIRPGGDDAHAPFTASEIEPLITMLLLIRARRSEQGWAALDLLAQDKSQQEIAAELGISPAAVSQRVKASAWKVEEATRPTLTKLLEKLEKAIAGTEQRS